MIFAPFDKYYLLSSASLVLLIQLVFFWAAYFLKTDKVTDLSYGLTFIALSVIFYFFAQELSLSLKIVYILIVIWGVRLSLYLFVRILKMGEDSRFDERRNNLVALAAFWGLQACTIWILMLPFTVSVSIPAEIHKARWGLPESLGFLIWFVGFLIETIADQQKFVFKNNPKNKKKWMETGLWAFSQHPNYFGEILLWWGMFFMIAPMLYGFYWLLLVGPVFITILITKVSGIPLLQASANKKYGDDPSYQNYIRRTNLLIPGQPKVYGKS